MSTSPSKSSEPDDTVAPVDPVGSTGTRVSALTPRQIVGELDRHVVGQNAAKRAVAIALRNRFRRHCIDDAMRDEVMPKNIILIGPTGVGKTEIARRLSKLANSPFIKVEASKFTEVGYVGRDAESMVRDLTDAAVALVREENAKEIEPRALEAAADRLLQLLLPEANQLDVVQNSSTAEADPMSATRAKLRAQLEAGKLENRMVEVDVADARPTSAMQIFTPNGMEEMDFNLREMLPGMFGNKRRQKKVKVSEARELLIKDESQKLIDMEAVSREAVTRVEESGIIFLDEIDKIADREAGGRGPDVSREGVQRDLLPIIEGTAVNTKYGMVRTDHILFIAAGAFHVSKPSDLIPEIQGRFPIRVELSPLDKADFVRVLTEPKGALTKQYIALMETEGIALSFDDEAIELIAEYAATANERAENIGARRLHTVMERLFDKISFDAPEMTEREIQINADYVREMLADVVKDADLSRYIL